MAFASNGKSQTTPASVAYQGEPGANSHIACIAYDERLEPVACATFEDAISAVRSGAVRCALIPVENSVAGRVADVHHLLPNSGVHVIGEHFERYLPISSWHFPGADLFDTLKTVHSHTQALGSVPELRCSELGFEARSRGRYCRGASHVLPKEGDLKKRRLRRSSPPRFTAFTFLKGGIEDAAQTPRASWCLPTKPKTPAGNGPVLTTFIFRVRNIPAALYKALGGFATNGVNMTKLESISPRQFQCDDVLCRRRRATPTTARYDLRSRSWSSTRRS